MNIFIKLNMSKCIIITFSHPLNCDTFVFMNNCICNADVTRGVIKNDYDEISVLLNEVQLRLEMLLFFQLPAGSLVLDVVGILFVALFVLNVVTVRAWAKSNKLFLLDYKELLISSDKSYSGQRV